MSRNGFAFYPLDKFGFVRPCSGFLKFSIAYAVYIIVLSGVNFNIFSYLDHRVNILVTISICIKSIVATIFYNFFLKNIKPRSFHNIFCFNFYILFFFSYSFSTMALYPEFGTLRVSGYLLISSGELTSLGFEYIFSRLILNSFALFSVFSFLYLSNNSKTT